MKCKFCGCTDARACPGGCSWFMPEVCSQCAEAAVRAYEPYNVNFSFQTTYRPRGLSLAADIEAVDYERAGTLDFMPVAGMLIDCGDGDLRKVHEVMFRAEDRQVWVLFEDCDANGRPHRFMLKHGWALSK
jgi:hypothetical protein